jgi:hypothetical protein
MSTIALAYVGRAVGTAIGAASGVPGGAVIGGNIGAAVGATIGSQIDQKYLAPEQHGYGPRLQDLRAQQSQLGAGKAIVKGSIRLAGQMMWATPYVEHASTTRSGGKGAPGGGATVTNYSYTQSMAIALCEGPIIGLRKIWANGKLIYNAGDSATNAQIQADNAAQVKWTLYIGNETQVANSRIQAEMAKIANTAYFNPAPLPIPAMRVIVSSGVIMVAGSPVRQLNQITPIIVPPASLSRIDRVIINKTTGAISVISGTPAGAPVAPPVPVGSYPCCKFQVNYNTIAITSVSDERVMPWKIGEQLYTDTYRYSNGNLYVSVSAGTTGSVAPIGTGTNIYDDPIDANIANAGAWAPSTGYQPGDRVVSGSNYYALVGFSAIVSGTIPPTGTGTNISDGNALWNYVQPRSVGVIWSYVEPFNSIPPLPTPAYRGTAYIVFYDYSLSQSGNTTPNFEFEVIEGTTDLGAVVTSIASMAALSPSQIDVTRLTGTSITGMVTLQRSSARAMLQPLAASYFFDALESDGVIKFIPRGGNLAVSIPETDLAAHHNGSKMPDQLVITRMQEVELPRDVSVQYMNQNNNYQPGTKYHRMQNTPSVLSVTLTLPIAMADSMAQGIADKMLNIAWNSRTNFQFVTGRKYAIYEPSDVIAVTKGQTAYEVRITHKEESAPGLVSFQGVMEDIGLYSTALNNLLDAVIIPKSINAAPGSIGTPIIIPAPGILTTNGFEVWIYAGSQGANWGGCGVFVSTDNINFTQVGVIRGSALYGSATVATGTDPDTVNTMVVSTAQSGQPMYSVSRADADNKISLCYVGGELISYQTATLSAANSYTLGYLRRGVYNTPIGAHKGAQFAAMDYRTFQYAYDPATIGQTIYFKFPSFNKYGSSGEDIASVPSYPYTLTGAIGNPDDVTGFAATVTNNGVMLSWNAVPQVNLVEYEIRVGGTSWATSSPASPPIKERTTRRKLPFQPIGSQTFWIKATDSSLRQSVNATSLVVQVTAPGAPVVTQQVIDNNVLLYWTQPTSTQPIATYEIRRGGTLVAGALVGGTVIGNKSGLFTTVFETVAGTYVYWVTAIDSAGIYGTPASVTATVNQPPDYVLKANFDSAFTGTLVSANLDHGSVVLPVNTTETFDAHFTAHGWTTPNAQIVAGFPVYAEPSAASGYYEEVITYASDAQPALASSKVTLTLNSLIAAGAPGVVTVISVKTLSTDAAWTDYNAVSSVYLTNFRLIKIRVTVTSSAGLDLLQINGINVRLDTKLKNDGGSVTCLATDNDAAINSAGIGGKTVLFNTSFITVTSITLSVQGITGTLGITPLYDLNGSIASPVGFKVYAFVDTTGARATGPINVSWAVKGY